MSTNNPLEMFEPAVRVWFENEMGEPTPPQRLGWPAIEAGEHTLILAPTGSGKTLAAFLACLNALWRQPALPKGVQVLYISPLKALNNDIHRNLQVPLEGVQATARELGTPLPELTSAVRTGDTPSAERQRIVRKPPAILITTPESLHLMLTSKAREVLRTVRYCIIDEIHALCSNKRGVFLALLLERLQAIQRGGSSGAVPTIQRIGLSATQRPLEIVARYLGGSEPDETGELVSRPVHIVDAGQRKNIDLEVVCPVEQFGPLPEKSVWPYIYGRLGDYIREHRSTIVFGNDRRAVERITTFLNENEEEEEPIARAHHGSVSLEARQQIESALKEGRLQSVVATASLELGIDMGAVDLVCQVASPGNVARGLQRVGRAGHLVGQHSKGRFISKSSSDLLEQAVLAREMLAGRVELLRVPSNCLDVLAQQLVALAAMDDWSIPELFALVRRAYPYRDLSPHGFEATLEMVSGRYRLTLEDDASSSKSLQSLQARASWDRVHDRLLALPGSQHLALRHGGVIPDTGQFGVYRASTQGGSEFRLGELDEEFVYERRAGDVFLLGTNAWRIERIDADRVSVSPAGGEPAVLPFWRGEGLGRSVDLGLAIGKFLGEFSDKLSEGTSVTAWLREECCLDPAAARSLIHFVQRQILSAGRVPTHRTLLVEASRDQLGDWQVLLLSPLGSRFHLGLRLAIEGVLESRLGYRPQCLHHDDGILVRLSDIDEPILDVLSGLTPENVEEVILRELADSPLFALRFRQNASRALLLPSATPDRRAPLWLQRLRGRDLLQVVRQYADFPIVMETYRECLHDHLDVERVKQLLRGIESGEVEIVTRRADVPSPFAGSLLFQFTAAFLYEGDQVESRESAPGVDRDLLDQLIRPESQEHLLDPRAVNQVQRRLRGVGRPPRSVAEMAEWLRQLGDLTTDELEGPMAGFLDELQSDGRAVALELPGAGFPTRWVSAEEEDVYRSAFGLGVSPSAEEAQQAGAEILGRFLQTHALVSLADVLERYPFEKSWARRQLEAWSDSGRLVRVEQASAPMVWSAPENLQQVQSRSLAMLRREVVACQPEQYADFVLRWQGAHPETRKGTREALGEVLEQLEGIALPPSVWEEHVLPTRVLEYQPRWLDEWITSGQGLWVCEGDSSETDVDRLRFVVRESLAQLRPPEREGGLSEAGQQVLNCLQEKGASYSTDLAMQTGLAPSVVRDSLKLLACRGIVTNDRFDVIRRGQLKRATESSGESTPPRNPSALFRRGGRRLSRRVGSLPAVQLEGRWESLRWGNPETEALAIFRASQLLARFGIIGRELAALDSWMPPWRVLYEVLSRMELTGEVRRGYFVEGLAGAQFALPEAVTMLEGLHLPSTASSPSVLINSTDPANLYGAGAPFDIPLLDGGVRPLLRRKGNFLVLRAGRPTLLIEQAGKRLSALSSASESELREAIECLPSLLSRRAGIVPKLTVEEWNGTPVAGSPGRALLESAGFVRDYQHMTLYSGMS